MVAWVVTEPELTKSGHEATHAEIESVVGSEVDVGHAEFEAMAAEADLGGTRDVFGEVDGELEGELRGEAVECGTRGARIAPAERGEKIVELEGAGEVEVDGAGDDGGERAHDDQNDR
jgi:hypothetical protein